MDNGTLNFRRKKNPQSGHPLQKKTNILPFICLHSFDWTINIIFLALFLATPSVTELNTLPGFIHLFSSLYLLNVLGWSNPGKFFESCQECYSVIKSCFSGDCLKG
jgi:hypothetical protein